MGEETALSLALSETPKTGFLTSQPKSYLFCGHQCCVNGSAALFHVVLYMTAMRNTTSFL